MFVNSHTLEKYFQWMYRPLCLYALNITESYEDSEDIVQQIFVELLEKAVVGSLEVGNMKGYLYTVVRNRAVKYVKKDQEKVSVESAMYLTDENILSISVEEEALVWNWIDALPTERRNIFLMAKQQGMKYKEIAEQLDISIKTVEGQMGKALKTLRDKAIKIYLFFFG
ncbi:sigma-70 family RNA polymerase sigma factor [Butyricimonas virosa]|uniref:RNA polymerase sigma-70 factor n=1 Tax=Butyricimonas virosa TaxID=544645 RepID=A0A415QMP6_9BACT|nr:sigma-70 family RNA polymerase sigma factor [Butyricimonas virosa]RHM45434.1 RNA polymerase sigma-70 factor [Butyricimonas virosa]